MESTLTLTWTDLQAEAGRELGWGTDPTGWDAAKLDRIDNCVQSALRKFYFQATTTPGEPFHGWTFLKPVATVQLAANQQTAPLPDDFGAFEGLATVALAGATGGGYWPIDQRHEEQLRALYAAAPTTTGRPLYFAEQQAAGGPTTLGSNRSELLVYPLPDNGYYLRVPYYVLPDYLTAARPYFYGGAAHAETIKLGVRAACELLLDGTEGPFAAAYQQCLAASVAYDRRHMPKTLGQNRDGSDLLLHFPGGRGRNWPDGLWTPLGIGFLGTASY